MVIGSTLAGEAEVPEPPLLSPSLAFPRGSTPTEEAEVPEAPLPSPRLECSQVEEVLAFSQIIDFWFV